MGFKKCEQNKRKRLKRMVVCIVLIFASVVSLFSCGKSTSGYEEATSGYEEVKSGYEEAVERFVKLGVYFECDQNELFAMAPEQFWQTKDINAVYGFFKEWYGSDKEEQLKTAKVNWEIAYLTKLSTEKCQEIESSLEEEHGVNYSVITEAYSFTLMVEITGGVNSDLDHDKMIAVKMGEKWYLVHKSSAMEYEWYHWAIERYV